MTHMQLVKMGTVFTAGLFSVHANADLIGINYTSGQVFSISTTDASVSYLGDTQQGIMGLDRSSDGTLYATTDGLLGGLGTLVDQRWSLEMIGSLNAGFTSEGGLAFDAQGRAFGGNTLAGGGRAVFQIDLTTGQAGKRIVLSRSSIDLNGLAFRSDGVMVGIDRVTNELVEVDHTSGEVNTVASLISSGIGSVGGLAIDAGVGYYTTAGTVSGSDGDNSLYGINLFSGEQWLVGELGDQAGAGFGIGALASASVPTPGVAGMIGIGGMLGARRRR
ncbi:MAG: hypothetical protein ACF8MF_10880 [Phycisphaerales bacterium JB052]